MVAAFFANLIKSDVVDDIGSDLHEISFDAAAVNWGFRFESLETEAVEHVAMQSAIEHLNELRIVFEFFDLRGLL